MATVTRKQMKRRTKKMPRQHWFSRMAPQQPKNPMIMMMAPRMSRAMANIRTTSEKFN